MGVRNPKVLHLVSGRETVDLVFKCMFIGLWQLLQMFVKRLWKGHRRKSSKNFPSVELTVDSSVGTHCYIKVMGVKYHYVESGPKTNKLVLVLGDAPDKGNLWGPIWSQVVRRLIDTGHQVITLDLRGTGGSEGGNRRALAPPKAVEELATLMVALGVSKDHPAVVIGFGIGGMLTWYLTHCYGVLISKIVVVGAPHPNLYWQCPPAAFCKNALYFIQWPHFPEKWLAEGELQREENKRWASSRACDWAGALNYVRGAAWWRIKPGYRLDQPALLIGCRESATQLVSSAQYCVSSSLRLIAKTEPADPELPGIVLDFLVAVEKPSEEPRGLVGRMLGAVADRGRELTAKLALPTQE